MSREDPRLIRLREIDDSLAEKGWPKISPWWWRVIERFYLTGKWCGGTVFECVIEGGRRGGKSSTIVKVAIAELTTTVIDDQGNERPFHHVAPGDVGYFGMISAEKGQAKARLLMLKKALIALGYTLSKDTTEELILSGKNLGAMAITATLSGVVSFTCIGALLDEVALWEDDSGANPAEAVVSSLKPTTATVPYALLWYVSAPWAEEGLHYAMMQAGDDATQIVFHGATWEMNPTLTREATRLLEKDYAAWLRAYGAVPMKTDETKFFPAVYVTAAAGEDVTVTEHDAEGTELKVGRTLRAVHVRGNATRTMAGGDMAFRRNSAAMTTLELVGARVRYATGEELIPGALPLKPSVTIRTLANKAAAAGAEAMACDLHYVETVREVLEEIQLPLLEFTTKTSEIEAAYVRTRVLLSEGSLDLSEAPPELIQQLKETTQKPNATGLGISNPLKNGRHGDWVSALVAAVWALEQPVPEENMAIGTRRFPNNRHEPVEEQLTDLPPTD